MGLEHCKWSNWFPDNTHSFICVMLVFEVLDDIVEIIHTGPGYWVNTQELKQAGAKGEKC